MKTYKELLNEIKNTEKQFVVSHKGKTVSTHNNELEAHKAARDHSKNNAGYVSVEGKHNNSFQSYARGRRLLS